MVTGKECLDTDKGGKTTVHRFNPAIFLWLSQPGFPTPYVVVFFVFDYLMWKMIVWFVDIGGIVDYHCLNFLFIIKSELNSTA